MAYRQYGYRLAEIVDHLGVHHVTVSRRLKQAAEATHSEGRQEERVLSPVFPQKTGGNAQMLRLLVEVGAQSIPTWSSCHGQGVPRPVQHPNE